MGNACARQHGQQQIRSGAGKGLEAEATEGSVIVNPAKELHFLLSNDNLSTSTFITLHRSEKSNSHLAFKIKSTKPGRYAVRPNHGLIALGSSAPVTIAIFMSEQGQRVILHGHELVRGTADRRHSPSQPPDKFLVQSCSVSNAFVKECNASKSKDETDALIRSVFNNDDGNDSSPIFDQELVVKHVVVDQGDKLPARLPIECMTPQEMSAELIALRARHDRLTEMNVDLLAQREGLQNAVHYALKGETACRPHVADPLSDESPQRHEKEPHQAGKQEAPDETSLVTLPLELL